MKGRRAFLAGVLTLGVASVPILVGGQQQQPPLFRAGTELVDLYVTVTDAAGRLVPDLVQEEFAIFDDEQVQEITLFENDVRPITVVVMLDTSISTTNVMHLILGGAEQFLIRMLPDDRGGPVDVHR